MRITENKVGIVFSRKVSYATINCNVHMERFGNERSRAVAYRQLKQDEV